MYFDEEERFPNPNLLHVVRRELYAINSNIEVTSFGVKYVPTHTEDGIPIRKLYVSNLPPKTTRAELHAVFAQYGFIKSCWLRMGDKGPNRMPTPTYAFVTFSNPGDAHKALQAPVHEKTLRGRNLRISPADSWHQPVEESDPPPFQPMTVTRPAVIEPEQPDDIERDLDGNVIAAEFPSATQEFVPPENELIAPENELLAPENELLAPENELLASENELLAPENELLAPSRGDAEQGPPQFEIPFEMQGGFNGRQRQNRRAVPPEILARQRLQAFKLMGFAKDDVPGPSVATQSKVVSTPAPRVETPTGLPADLNILDILNRDCLSNILAYLPIRDLIRTERVSKTWQIIVREYLDGTRVFKTSWWQHVPVILTTAVLRRVLQRVGASLARLHIDHHWSALNDRTAHTVGKFCPNLEELKIVGMHTRNWNPLIYGCKQLKSLSFVSCNKLTDSSLVHLVKSESCIESITIANNTHVTGLFLTGSNPQKLSSLAFYNCYSLQGTVLSAAMDSLPKLSSLKLDVCPPTMWKIIPLILRKLPHLKELSLSEYISVEMNFLPECEDAFCDALATLSELKILNLSRNIYITNSVLKRVAQSCPNLESLNISSCNARRMFTHPGVGNEGLAAVCRYCRELRALDVSYLATLTDAGLSGLVPLPFLRRLTARGMPALSAEPFSTLIAACPLQEVDVCGCDGVSEEVVAAAVRALEDKPRPMLLRLAGTAAAPEIQHDFPTHKWLTVDVHDDRSNPQLRPDFEDHIFEDSSDDSLADLYDHDDFDDFFGADDVPFMEEDLENFEELYQFGQYQPDIVLL